MHPGDADVARANDVASARLGLIATALLLALLRTALCGTHGARADDIGAAVDCWDRLVRNHVDDGSVDYEGWSADPDRHAECVRLHSRIDDESLDRDEQVAFWINAHNLFVVDAVLSGARPRSLRGRVSLHAWHSREIAGRRHTLESIRDRLRELGAGDPRVYLALSNGARGGPDLAHRAYRAERLDAQLARAARRFVRDSEKNRIDLARRVVSLSRVFQWYEPDFVRAGGSLGGFVGSFLPGTKAPSILRRPEVEVSFLPFDWRLDGRPPERE